MWYKNAESLEMWVETEIFIQGSPEKKNHGKGRGEGEGFFFSWATLYSKKQKPHLTVSFHTSTDSECSRFYAFVRRNIGVEIIRHVITGKFRKFTGDGFFYTCCFVQY